MALLTKVKSLVNGLLEFGNLRLETRTAERREHDRLAALAARGHFGGSAFPLLPQFKAHDPGTIITAAEEYRPVFDVFEGSEGTTTGYSFRNEHFTSPDAEVYYSLLRHHRPKTIVEVGSGYSTRLARKAISDGRLETKLICIDPCPRTDVSSAADELVPTPVEAIGLEGILARLARGDILFIDGTHRIRPGNDVVFLYLCLLPALPEGVLIHVHDVFLPYEYPYLWIVDMGWDWNEQYLVHCLLEGNTSYEVIWAGHFLQRTEPHFERYFPHAAGRVASSLWLRKTALSRTELSSGVFPGSRTT